VAVTLSVDDLTPFAPDIDSGKAEVMIADALALAARVAPCIETTDDESVTAAAKAIVRGAVLRWHASGDGAVQHISAGPFQQSIDTRQARRSMFWPSEISDLQSLCDTGARRKAFMVDTLPPEDGS
jgi:hypothetical protein